MQLVVILDGKNRDPLKTRDTVLRVSIGYNPFIRSFTVSMLCFTSYAGIAMCLANIVSSESFLEAGRVQKRIMGLTADSLEEDG